MRRNWLVAGTVVGIVAIVIAVLILRLTDDEGGQSASAWADSVCTSLSDWRSSITSLADVSGGTLTPALLGEKLDAAESATLQLITELKELGRPDLAAGEELSLELDAAVNELEADFETLKSGAENAAEADTPSAFLQALAMLAPAFQGLLDQIRTTVDDLQNASVAEEAETELQRAFDEAESCRELREQS